MEKSSQINFSIFPYACQLKCRRKDQQLENKENKGEKLKKAGKWLTLFVVLH